MRLGGKPASGDGEVMSGLRVTFVIFSMDGGGAQRVMSIMANYWAARNWKITLLTYGREGRRSAYDLHPTVTQRALDIEGASSNLAAAALANVRRLWSLRRAIEASDPQVVISFLDRVNVRTILATIGLKVPVIVSERNHPGRRGMNVWWRVLRRCTYPFAGCLVAQTARAMELFGGTVRRKGRVIPNPVRLPAESGGRDRGAGSRTVVGMGRLIHQKGFDRLLRAFAVVATKHDGWLLEIWGEGEDREQLETLRDDLGLRGRAFFPGWAGDAMRELRRADLVVLSSRYEGFPNVLCEAMACGAPVVSFDCPYGPGDIVRHGVDGILVAPDDVEELAHAMDRLMGDDDERDRLGHGAGEIVSRFGVEKVMGMWEEAVNDALNGP